MLFFAVAFDRRGQLGWQTPFIVDEEPGYGGAHIVQVMCENVSDAYLAYLQKIGISYLFAGKEELNLPLAVSKLKLLFGIETLLLEGGSIINGAFQRADLVDELSLVVAPMIGSKEDKPLFMDSHVSGYVMQSAQPSEDGVVWLRYKRA